MLVKLSAPLLKAYSSYCDIRSFKPFYRKTLDCIHSDLPNFLEKKIYFSTFDEFISIINFIFSKNTKKINISFNNKENEYLNNIIHKYNIERSKFYSLYLCSLFFTTGKYSVDITDFLSNLLSDILYYQYEATVTKHVYKMYLDFHKKNINFSITNLIRAAHFYYRHVAPNDLVIIESNHLSIKNNSTKGKKITVRGNFALKNYIFNLKENTGKSINCIVNNMAYQFLSIAGSNIA